MSQAVNINQRLAALTAAGTSPWLDQIRRSLTQGGELRRMIEEDCLRGETSNPAIFEKAILGSPDYDEQIEQLARAGALARAIYQEIAIQDVQEAADVLRSVFDDLDGDDGFVSLEVDPDLAFDADRTLAQAREYWARVDRPNAMIKIPGTPECLPAIEQAIFEGININVTLLFSVEAYATVAESYIEGLERRSAEGKDLDVRSVASFFVSRVDSEVDKRLEAIDRCDLQGQAAVANARAAYRRFEEIFYGERFADLRSAGAHVQRPLWASTGVKNPSYKETKYVEELVGPDTVNTMPMQTLLACAERLEVTGETVREDPTPVLEALAAAGIDIDDVTDKLLREGIDAFVTPMEKLLAGIEAKREAIFTGRPETIDSSLPDELEPLVHELVRRAEESASRDGSGPRTTRCGGRRASPRSPTGSAGWRRPTRTPTRSTSSRRSRATPPRRASPTPSCSAWAARASRRRCCGARSAARSTAACACTCSTRPTPARCSPSQRAVDLTKTLFLVSTKSGGTIETISLFEHFWSKRPHGEQYVAITDPGSSLEALAAERGFRRTFLNDPDVGGRYSALTYFGLVPAALMGVDLETLLEARAVAAEACSVGSTVDGNSGLWLGAALAALALQGRDKLTFVVDAKIASFGLWVEQLVAESLGKQGKGIVPVTDEPLGEGGRAVYGDDRVFCYLRDNDDPSEALDEQVRALAAAGQPTVTLSAGGPDDLGRIFFFAEFATAVAGWALQINPFDQPDVQVAKDTTGKLLAEIAAGGELHEPDDAERRCAARAARRGDGRQLRRDPRLHGAERRRRRGGRAAARGDPRRDDGDDDVRLRTALPALDRPAAQGRAVERALPRARARRARGRRDPRQAVHVPRAEERAGVRRLETLRSRGRSAVKLRLTAMTARPPCAS